MNVKTNDYWVTEYNYLDEVSSQLDIPERVEIYDLTLREGNQTPGCVMRRDELYDIALGLDDLGVEFLEFFPAVSKDDEAVATDLVRNKVLKNAKVSCLVRPRTKDMEYALKCKAKHIFLEGPSNIYSGKTMNYSSVDEIVQSFLDTVKIAKDNGMTITACPWDNGKATVPILEKWVTELAAAGVEDICYGDTFNFTMPWTVTHMVRKYRKWSDDKAIISTHFHNDYGLGTAATLAAVAGGARRVQVGMNNLGERAGNTALDEVAVNLALNMGVKTNIDLKKLYPLSRRIEAITKMPLGRKKPFTGEEIAWMGSGIVVDVLQKLQAEGDNFNVFLPFNAEMVGNPVPFKVVYGKGVGTNMIRRLAESLGLNPTKEQVAAATVAVKEEALITKSLVDEELVKKIIRDNCK